jgi:hypothetical protein
MTPTEIEAGDERKVRLNRLDKPEIRAHQDWRGRWGVQIRWPATGPWTRHQLWPRWAWHGPFGNGAFRYDSKVNAEAAAEAFAISIGAAIARAGGE